MPGSQTTLAQLGLPESFTPAQFRCPTRMFPGAKKGEYEPYLVRPKVEKVTEQLEPVKLSNGDAAAADASKADVDMADAPPTTNGEAADKVEEDGEEDGATFEEDPTSGEGAVSPIHGGRIVDWECFYALITHIHNKLSPPFHTPVLMVSQPAWTSKDHECISQ